MKHLTITVQIKGMTGFDDLIRLGWWRWKAFHRLSIRIQENRAASARIDGAASFRVSMAIGLICASIVTATRRHLSGRGLVGTEDEIRATIRALFVAVKVVGVPTTSTVFEFLAALRRWVVEPTRDGCSA